MKKFSKVLALVAVLLLVVGTIPVSAATTNLKLTKSSKTIFVGKCTGSTDAGKAAKYYSYFAVNKLVKNFKSSSMDIKLTTSDKSVAKVNNKKDRVTAVAPGSAKITVKVYQKKKVIFTDTINVTVKKNATASTLLVEGIKDGDEIKEGTTVKVSLTRKAGSDTDLRRLSSASDGVTIKSAGTRKYKVTFAKAGSVQLLAEAYQSSTYDGATASKTINVTVVGDKKEEEKKEEEVAALTAAQTATNAYTLKGSAITDTFKKEDIKISYKVGTVDIAYSKDIKDFKVEDGVATITMFTDFEQDTTYYVTVGEETAEFKTVALNKENPLSDIKTIRVLTSKVDYNAETTLEFAYLNADGIDITTAVKDLADSQVEVTIANGTEYASCTGHSIYAYEKNKQLVINVSLITGYDLTTYENIVVKTSAALLTYEKPAPTVSGSKYTFVKDDGIYLKDTDKLSQTICINDAGYVLETLFTYSDGKVLTPVEAGVTKITSSTETVLMITGAMNANGGVEVYPVAKGESYISYYVGDTVVAGFKVTVSDARKAVKIFATADKNKLNTNSLIGDSIIISAAVYDQYGAEMPDAPIVINQVEGTMNNAMVSFGAFVNGRLVVNASDVSITGTLPNVNAIVSSGDLKQTVNFLVKDVAYDASKLNTSAYQVTLKVEGDRNIDTLLVEGAQEDEPTYVFAEITSDGYYLGEAIMMNTSKLLKAAPTAQLKSSDFGVADGTVVITSTIQFIPEGSSTATFIDTADNMDVQADSICFDPVTAGKKLAKGRYTVSTYIITAGASSSTIKQVGTTTIVVTESKPATSVKRINETAKAPGTIEQQVPVFFEFYIDGVKLDPSKIKSVNAITGTGSSTTYVTSVTFGLTNTPYGAFDLVIPVGASFRVIA